MRARLLVDVDLDGRAGEGRLHFPAGTELEVADDRPLGARLVPVVVDFVGRRWLRRSAVELVTEDGRPAALRR